MTTLYYSFTGVGMFASCGKAAIAVYSIGLNSIGLGIEPATSSVLVHSIFSSVVRGYIDIFSAWSTY